MKSRTIKLELPTFSTKAATKIDLLGAMCMTVGFNFLTSLDKTSHVMLNTFQSSTGLVLVMFGAITFFLNESNNN